MRRIRTMRFILGAMVVILLAGISVAVGVDAAATKTFTATSLATGSFHQFYPETEGDLVVYQSRSPIPGADSDIIVRNLTTGETKTIGGGDGFDQLYPDVSQGRVVYEDHSSGNSDIRVWDSWLNTDYAIASSTDDEYSPRISGNLVAWWDKNEDEIQYKDLARGESGSIVPDVTSDYTNHDVDRGRIFWTKDQARDSAWVFEPGRSIVSDQIYSPLSPREITSIRGYGDWAAITIDYAGTPQAYRRSTEAKVGDAMADNTAKPAVFADALAYQTNPPAAQQNISWHRKPFASSDTDQGTVAGTGLTETVPSMYGNRVVYQYLAGPMNMDIYMATSASEVGRTEGTTRYTTAVEASKAYFHASENAVLCTGLNFPDALAAGPLARLLGGPLLLTKTDSVSTQVMSELARLEVETVFIIGGPVVVSDAVVTQLEDAGYAVERIAGSDRYATSVEIAKYMDTQLAGAWSVDTAFFARGDNFPDALAVGPVAAGALSPIILVKPTVVPGTVAGVVNTLDITSGVIVGGSDVVSDDVRDSLESIMQDNGAGADPIERWAGDDRYATAIEVVKNGVAARWVDLDCVGVATGWNFPDALGGGAALGRYGSPLLLVKGETVPSTVTSWVKDNKFAIAEMDIFGGSDVVPDSVKTTLTSLIN